MLKAQGLIIREIGFRVVEYTHYPLVDTPHRIFPKLGMKLKDNKGNKVTEPNFPKKNLDHSKFFKNMVKNEVF